MFRKVASAFVLMFICVHGSAQIVSVEQTKNYDSISLRKLKVAVRLLDSVLQTDDFRTRVLAAKFVGAKGKTNQQIYENLMSGNTKYDTSNDRRINLFLAEYDNYAGGGELGKTVGKVTSTHRCFILRRDVRCLVGHLIHEYMHVMGFSHRKISSERPKLSTVPYVIGTIVKTMLASPACRAVGDNCKINPPRQRRH